MIVVLNGLHWNLKRHNHKKSVFLDKICILASLHDHIVQELIFIGALFSELAQPG